MQIRLHMQASCGMKVMCICPGLRDRMIKQNRAAYTPWSLVLVHGRRAGITMIGYVPVVVSHKLGTVRVQPIFVLRGISTYHSQNLTDLLVAYARDIRQFASSSPRVRLEFEMPSMAAFIFIPYSW